MRRFCCTKTVGIDCGAIYSGNTYDVENNLDDLKIYDDRHHDYCMLISENELLSLGCGYFMKTESEVM